MAAPLISITVEQNITRALDQLERELEIEIRALASRTGVAIRDTARASVSVDEGVTRDNLVSVDDERGTSVFVRTTPQRPTNLDLWLERGTTRMDARPYLHPAKDLHRARYEREAESVVRRAVAHAGGGR